MKKLLLAMLFPVSLTAQSSAGYGVLQPGKFLGQQDAIPLAVPFLRIAPDARAGGMGDGSVALSNDANAMFWNPSRLAFNKTRYGFAASYSPWLRALVPDVNHFYTAAYFKPDSVSAIGASFRYFSLGSWSPAWIAHPDRSNEMAFDIGYARKLNSHLSLGITGRYFRSSNVYYYGGTEQGYAADIGATWVGKEHSGEHWSGHLQSGLAVTNMGPKIRYELDTSNKDFLPANLALATGAEFHKDSKHFFAVQVEVNKLLVPSPPVYAMDANGNPIPDSSGGYVIAYGKDPDRNVWEGMAGSFSDAPRGAKEEWREISWSAGIEYDYKHIVKARTGFFYEHPLKGNRKYVTFGVGAKYKNVAFDVSYLLPVNAQRSPLQHTFKFTLLVHWNRFHK